MSMTLHRFVRPVLGWAFLLTLFLVPSARAQVLGDIVDVRAVVEDLATVRTGKQLSVGVSGLVPFSEVTGVAVEIGASTMDLDVSLRFLDGPDAGVWVDLYVVPSATGGTAVAGWRRDEPFDATRFEIRAHAPAEARLEIREVGFFDARGGEEAAAPTDQQPLTGAKTGSIVPPPLVTRAQWNARPFIGTPSALARPSYDFMTWHHAAGYSAENLDQGKAQMRAMQDLHQNVRGWSDIGYQFAIDRAGNLYQGRPFMDNSTSLSQVPVLALGAHAGGANTGNIGVVIMGCYHPPEGSHCEQEITPAAFATYINLFAFLSERYGVEPEMIRGHRDFGQTACPGDNNYALIPELISRVSQVLITGNEPLGEAVMSGSVDGEGVVSLQWSIAADFGIEELVVERVAPSGTVILPVDALVASSYTDASLAGEPNVTYLLIASHSDGRRQEMARVELDIADPSRFLMTSAFPNPAADAFEVRYFLSAEGFVTLTLHDARGREVSRYEPGFVEGDQWVSRRYDVSSMAAGVYYLRLRIRSFGGTAFDRTIPVVVAR
jgi:hypothetical protein